MIDLKQIYLPIFAHPENSDCFFCNFCVIIFKVKIIAEHPNATIIPSVRSCTELKQTVLNSWCMKT